VVHLSDNPGDSSKLLIGFESGQLALWDLRTRCAEIRWQAAEALRSVAWHHEGKQFVCSHADGSLTTWGARAAAPKPLSVTTPHGKREINVFFSLFFLQYILIFAYLCGNDEKKNWK
jgi:syntaxin-binding protein 5